jgi:hypothetical protein
VDAVLVPLAMLVAIVEMTAQVPRLLHPLAHATASATRFKHYTKFTCQGLLTVSARAPGKASVAVALAGNSIALANAAAL